MVAVGHMAVRLCMHCCICVVFVIFVGFVVVEVVVVVVVVVAFDPVKEIESTLRLIDSFFDTW